MEEPARLLDDEEAEEARRVAERGAELARDPGFEATPLIARGKPNAWPVLLDLAEEHDVAAVVVGSRGLGGVRSALFGSVSSGVLDRARRPVLVVPPLEDEEPAGSALACYDGSEQAEAALAAAGRLLRGREILVETVWRSSLAVAAAGMAGAPAAVVVESAQAIDAELRQGAERLAVRGAEIAAEQGLEARAEVADAEGSVWRALLDVARDRRAAVIVLGSRGRSAFMSNLLGSVSRAMVHHAPAPVLVVRPPDETR